MTEESTSIPLRHRENGNESHFHPQVQFHFLTVPWLTCVALKMAEKHETNPSHRKKGKFRQSVVLGPASAWGPFDLDLFRVDYEKNMYYKLPDEVSTALYDSDTKDRVGNAR